MKKRLMSKLLITTLMSTMLFTAIPSFATDTIAIKIVLNGQEISYNESSGFPFIDNSGRTLVPFRQTMEAFGCDVNWNQTNQIATASKNGTTVQVPIGESYVLKGTEKVQNDTQAVVKNGKTYLPIRVVLESFGADVTWDNNSKAVVAKSETENTNNQNSSTEIPIVDAHLDNTNKNIVPFVPPVESNELEISNLTKTNYQQFKTNFNITTEQNAILYFTSSLPKEELKHFIKNQNQDELKKYIVLAVQEYIPSTSTTLARDKSEMRDVFFCYEQSKYENRIARATLFLSNQKWQKTFSIDIKDN